jgi:hypothetical protein
MNISKANYLNLEIEMSTNQIALEQQKMQDRNVFVEIPNNATVSIEVLDEVMLSENGVIDNYENTPVVGQQLSVPVTERKGITEGEVFDSEVYESENQISSSAVASANPMSNVDQFAEKFHFFAEKTAESTIKMCRVVALAKAHLKKNEFEKFCLEIGQKENSSTLRKYLAIGDRYEQFICYAERLPNSWTSLYLITQIPSEKFVELIEGAVTFADVTAKEINELLGKETSIAAVNKGATSHLLTQPAVQIYFDRMPSTVDWNTLKLSIALLVEKNDSGLRIEFSEKFKKNHNLNLRKNEISAKQRRAMEKQAQKRIDQQDFANPPFFEFH